MIQTLRIKAFKFILKFVVKKRSGNSYKTLAEIALNCSVYLNKFILLQKFAPDLGPALLLSPSFRAVLI